MDARRLLITILALCSVASTLRAQASLPERTADREIHENIFGLGLAAGPMSGVGLSFRHHLPGALSYQIVGGIIKADQNLSYSYGVEVQYDLVRSVPSRFYVGGGGGYFYSGSTSHNDMDGPARLGLGVGGEIVLAPNLNVAADLMITYFSDGTVLPMPQIGIHYYFY